MRLDILSFILLYNLFELKTLVITFVSQLDHCILTYFQDRLLRKEFSIFCLVDC